MLVLLAPSRAAVRFGRAVIPAVACACRGPRFSLRRRLDLRPLFLSTMQTTVRAAQRRCRAGSRSLYVLRAEPLGLLPSAGRLRWLAQQRVPRLQLPERAEWQAPEERFERWWLAWLLSLREGGF